ncbi:hypothetical protein PanWU01x14_288340 [Parasponia andersonii]|uniref:Uncharacterized protein n=1 Tax=Parasponia andersonii TaxID=3476 RepID=A0A2P5AYC8_PARAD|nr:hypothetical protein PanWU01x14_288340 [Parasponia andersonii]
MADFPKCSIPPPSKLFRDPNKSEAGEGSSATMATDPKRRTELSAAAAAAADDSETAFAAPQRPSRGDRNVRSHGACRAGALVVSPLLRHEASRRLLATDSMGDPLFHASK